MSHDFAKQSYPNNKKANKRGRDVNQHQLTPQYQIGQNKLSNKCYSMNSMWFIVAFGAILIMITFIKSSLHLSTNSGHTNQSEHKKHLSKKNNLSVKNKSNKPRQHTNQSFHFYSMLRHLQLETQNTKQLESLQDYASHFDYILQVASTRQRSIADQITEQLALLGLIGHIDQVKINDRDWWRVRLGPYHDIKQVDSVKALLDSNKINYLEFQHKSQKQ